jgi:hypothetical protein
MGGVSSHLFTAMNTGMSLDNVLAQRPDMKALSDAEALEYLKGGEE